MTKTNIKNMQRIDLPIADDEHAPPWWRIEAAQDDLAIAARHDVISSDVERVESAQHFVFDEDEFIVIAIFGGAVEIDGVAYASGDVLVPDEEDEVRIVPRGGRAAVARIIEC